MSFCHEAATEAVDGRAVELVEPHATPAQATADNRAGLGIEPGVFRHPVVQTGAAWRFLPDEFPSPSTCGGGSSSGKTKAFG